MSANEHDDDQADQMDVIERLRAENAELRNDLVRGSEDMGRICAENEALRKALRPFARAADAVDDYDPSAPEDMAALRAAFDWHIRWTGEAGTEVVERNNVRVGDLRAARAALTRKPAAP